MDATNIIIKGLKEIAAYFLLLTYLLLATSLIPVYASFVAAQRLRSEWNKYET